MTHKKLLEYFYLGIIYPIYIYFFYPFFKIVLGKNE